MRNVPAHYIKPNHKANVPKRMVVIDAAAVSEYSTSGERQSWRCGAAIFIHWTSKGFIHRETRTYLSPDELWGDVCEFTRKKQRTIVYAHNLPYDLRITDALRCISARKFKLEAIRVSSQGSWSRWSKDQATLTLCDSASVFPITVGSLGLLVDCHRLRLPNSEDVGEWMAVTVRNAEIVANAMTEYWSWLRTGVAGNWQMTGAGQSWAHWRHSHYTHPVLVHPDMEAIAAERRAMWTGRAENWRHGKDLDAPIYEWDWANSYPRVVRDWNVPVRFVGQARKPSPRDLQTLASKYIINADVEVQTDKPIVPTSHDGRIIWPIGSFRTTLWWPEIEALIRAGQTVRPERIWLYRGEPALRQWAQWIIGEIHDPDFQNKKWLGPILKHWSRTLIGRFATQYQNWELFGRDTSSKVMIGHLFDNRTKELSDVMQVGHDLHIMTGMSESDDSCPQITSYVMSVARRRLWDAMVAVGLEHVYYVDTDSLVVDMEGHVALTKMTRAGRFEGLRLKGRHRGYEIYGPRAAIFGPKQVFAGMPRDSRRVTDEEWQGQVWTQLERALRTGEHDRVTITNRKFTVRYNDKRRIRTGDGRTVARVLPEDGQPESGASSVEPVQESPLNILKDALGATPLDGSVDSSAIGESNSRRTAG